MPKEILLYGRIYSDSSSEFVKEMDSALGEDVTIRINSSGGEPEYGWGMIAKMVEHPMNKAVKVDGQAASMAAFFCCYADSVECLDVSEFLFHRAAYSPWLEASPEFFTEAMKQNLARINASLEKAFRNKVDVEKFESLKGVKVKDIFSMESRLDVFVSAKEAKQIKLVDKVNDITPSKRAEIEADLYRITAQYNGLPAKKEADKIEVPEPTIKKNIMTLAELQAQHPELYNQALTAGATAAKKAEADRVGAWMTFVEVDPKVVAEGIKSGEALSQTATAEFSMKMISGKKLAEIETESAPNLDPKGAASTKGAEAANESVKNASMDEFLKEASTFAGHKLVAGETAKA